MFEGYVPKTALEKEALERNYRKYLLLGQLAGLAKRNEILKDYDDKTGLLRYEPFRKEVKAIREGKKPNARGKDGSLVILDIDDFKGLNGSLGHDVVDKLILKPTARIIDNAGRRETDAKTCRYGGEEFLIYLDGTDLDNAHGIAHRLQNEINELGVGVSVGVTAFTPYTSFETALHQADQALLAAKNTPTKNDIVIWVDGMEQVFGS